MNFKKTLCTLTCVLFATTLRTAVSDTNKQESNVQKKTKFNSQEKQTAELKATSDESEGKSKNVNVKHSTEIVELFNPKAMVFTEEDYTKANAIYNYIVEVTKSIAQKGSESDIAAIMNNIFILMFPNPRVAYLVLQKAISDHQGSIMFHVPCFLKGTARAMAQLFYMSVAAKHNMITDSDMSSDKLDNIAQQVYSKYPEENERIQAWTQIISENNSQLTANLIHKSLQQMLSSVNKDAKIMLYSADTNAFVSHEHGPTSVEEISATQYVLMLCTTAFLYSMVDESVVKDIESGVKNLAQSTEGKTVADKIESSSKQPKANATKSVA